MVRTPRSRNWISSPGSGKTTLLEGARAFPSAAGSLSTCDLATEDDAHPPEALCRNPVKQITTGGTRHLDARMIEAHRHWNLDELDLLIIENVGNLVCPSKTMTLCRLIVCIA